HGGRLQIGTGGRLRSEEVPGFKTETPADFISEPAADLRRNQQLAWIQAVGVALVLAGIFLVQRGAQGQNAS
ncbi:MAG: hypothetical protein AB7K73_15935, partial [Gammaproteobacteria bacterium]